MMITANDGQQFDPDVLDQSYVYANGVLSYIEVHWRGNQYRQNYSYVAGKLSNISVWVKQ